MRTYSDIVKCAQIDLFKKLQYTGFYLQLHSIAQKKQALSAHILPCCIINLSTFDFLKMSRLSVHRFPNPVISRNPVIFVHFSLKTVVLNYTTKG